MKLSVDSYVYPVRILITFILLFIWSISGSMGNQVHLPPDRTEFDSLMDLSREFQYRNADKTLMYALQALEYANENENPHLQGQGWAQVARAHIYSGNYSRSLEAFRKAYQYFEMTGDSQSVANQLLNMGECYRRMGDFGKAMDKYVSASVIYEAAGDDYGLAALYLNMGIVYKESGDTARSLQLYHKALEYAEAARDTKSVSSVYNNLGNIFAEKGNYAKAASCFQKSLQLRRAIGAKSHICQSLMNLGVFYHEIDSLQQAMEYFEEAYGVAEETGDRNVMAYTSRNLGMVYYDSGRYDSAVIMVSRALALVQGQEDYKLIQQIYGSLAKIYFHQGKYQEAYHAKITESLYRDTLTDKLMEQELLELQARYEAEQMEQQINRLQEETRLVSGSRNLAILGALLATGLAVLIFIHFRTRISKNRKILEHQKALYHKERELVKAEQEKERLREKQLKQELELKSRQLTVHALNIIQKNKMLEELRSRIDELKHANGQTSGKISTINRFISRSMDIDKDWETFGRHFEQVNNDFFKRLKQQYPDISTAELRLAALIKLNMSVKEAAGVLNISPGSVKTARYRLRKRLRLSDNQNLNNFLITF